MALRAVGLASDAHRTQTSRQLYRILTTDLATQTNFRIPDLLLTLNQLPRARTRMSIAVSRSPSRVCSGFPHDLPRTFRANIHYSRFPRPSSLWRRRWSHRCPLQRGAAGIILSPRLIDYIHRHEMWTEHFFSVSVSVASTRIFINNISVAFSAFALGPHLWRRDVLRDCRQRPHARLHPDVVLRVTTCWAHC